VLAKHVDLAHAESPGVTSTIAQTAMRDVLDMLRVPTTLGAVLVSALLVAVAARLFIYERNNQRTGTNAGRTPVRQADRHSSDAAARPCTAAGPVLAARVANLDLSGLTVIPITRLPRLYKRLRIPLLERTVVLYADLTASELVFRRLRVGSATATSRDTGRESIEVTADRVELDLTGSIGVRAGYHFEGEGEPQGRAVRASGRVHVTLADASSRVGTRLVSRPAEATPGQTSRPGLRCQRVDFHPGNISVLSLSGFVPFLRLEALAHYVRNSSLVRISTRRFAGFLVHELVQGPVCSDLLSDLEGFIDKHVDLAPFARISDSDRDRALARFSRDSIHPHHQNRDDTTTAAFTTTTAPSSATALRLHALVLGPIHLHSLSLPSSASAAENGDAVAVPVFARRDQTGLRYSILSSPILNQLTRGPPDVTFGPSRFDKIELEEASVELEPHTLDVLEGESSGSKSPEPESKTARELVLRVHGLAATLSIGFRIGADLRAAPALVTGMKVLEEKGVATTEIAERSALGALHSSNSHQDSFAGTEAAGSFQAGGLEDDLDGIAIRLPVRWDRTSGRVLLTSRHDDEDELASASALTESGSTSSSRRKGRSRGNTAGRGIRLEGAFGTVAPRIKLESRLGKLLGERVVNALLESVQVCRGNRYCSARGITCQTDAAFPPPDPPRCLDGSARFALPRRPGTAKAAAHTRQRERAHGHRRWGSLDFSGYGEAEGIAPSSLPMY
jgi:hypothetical protein